MNKTIELIQHEIPAEMMKGLTPRQRNQFVGCMHAHNELVFLNRLLMFCLNGVGEGDLHDAAQGVQMWCVLQALTGKLFETWNMLRERFLKAKPEDPALAALGGPHRASLDWLKNYFGDDQLKDNGLRTIRDKTAFHYDKLNLEGAMTETGQEEHSVFLAQHPVNSLYYAGSALIFETVFGMIADQSMETKAMTPVERMREGVRIALNDVNNANLHMHALLYGLIKGFLEPSLKDKAQHTRVQVLDAPKPASVALPMFLDIEG